MAREKEGEVEMDAHLLKLKGGRLWFCSDWQFPMPLQKEFVGGYTNNL